MDTDKFWSMSLCEFYAVCEGYAEANGAKPNAITRPEVDALYDKTTWRD